MSRQDRRGKAMFKRFWRPRGVEGIEEVVHGGTPVALSGVPSHWHEQWQLCAVVRGDGWVRVRGTEHRTPAGTLFLVPPGEVHSNNTYEQGCDFRSMLIDDTTVRQATEASGLPCSRLACLKEPVLASPKQVRGYVRLHHLLTQPGEASEAECQFAEMLAAVLGRATDRQPAPPGRSPHPAARRAREILHDRAIESVPLAELARACGLSRFELVRQFKRAYGMPPHAWQVQARINKAKPMLQAGRPSGQIAVALGFADQAHFIRAFRGTVGTTPARYAAHFRKIVQ